MAQPISSSSTQPPRNKFQGLLRKLFQFDSAELDFGIYRIMNQKRAVIERFIEKDLLDGVSRELASGALAQESEIARQIAEVIAQIKATLSDEALDTHGNLAAEYHSSKLGKQYLELRQRATGAKSNPEQESEIFNHLYTFFSRYYDDGDFMSLRRYSKRDKYAIPYNGEETHFYWANKGQYYIKTAENFADYSYKYSNWTVQFKLRNADVEQNNNNGPKRFFLPRIAEIEVDSKARVFSIPFEYRPLSANEEITYRTTPQKSILAAAAPQIAKAAQSYPDALAALLHETRTDADGNAVSLYDHHSRRYVQKNLSDFFIHKDLKGFLGRELDFYLKNEVLNVDELEAGGELRAARWFQTLRIIKGVGHQIISFVSQIENFQKRLFEKKKFVTAAHYCLTLDRVPEELYPQILKNKEQISEWKQLLHIQDIEADLTTPQFKEPLRVDFLRANPWMMIDTRFFAPDFKDQLLASIKDIDATCDGLLIHSENYQGLQLIKERYRSEVSCIYIDPPYNSDAGPISYKNGYRHSSWLALVENRIGLAKHFLDDSAIICVTIDDNEAHHLRCLCDSALSETELLGVVAIKNNPAGRTATVGFSICHEYAFFYGKPDAARVNRMEHSDAQKARYKEKDALGFFEWTNFRKHGGLNTYRTARPRQFYPIYVHGVRIRIPDMTWDEDSRKWTIDDPPRPNEEVLLPIDEKGRERIWDFVPDTARKNIAHFLVRKDANDSTAVYRKWRINEEGLLPQTWWDKSLYSAPEYGTNLLTNLFGTPHAFMFPKSVYAVADCLKVSGLRNNQGGLVLDFFAGSGTTGHATINLNREDGGTRQYILVESGNYFDEVLLSRIKKIVYSKDWKDGKPVSRQGSSQTCKYIRIESYEDALDNIAFQGTDAQAVLQLDDYVLSYMLDFETKHSDTLLNVAKLEAPFDYKVHRYGADDPQPIDLPETFNYLIGLRVESRRVMNNKSQRYLVYRGRADERATVIIWRTTRGWTQKEFEADRDFVSKQKLTKGAEDIFVNTDSFIPDARSLDPVFKRRMFNEE